MGYSNQMRATTDDEKPSCIRGWERGDDFGLGWLVSMKSSERQYVVDPWYGDSGGRDSMPPRYQTVFLVTPHELRR